MFAYAIVVWLPQSRQMVTFPSDNPPYSFTCPGQVDSLQFPPMVHMIWAHTLRKKNP